eukprot:9922816-Prorocentrum_lima.AAC.1
MLKAFLHSTVAKQQMQYPQIPITIHVDDITQELVAPTAKELAATMAVAAKAFAHALEVGLGVSIALHKCELAADS